jgi:hypothetical protein
MPFVSCQEYLCSAHFQTEELSRRIRDAEKAVRRFVEQEASSPTDATHRAHHHQRTETTDTESQLPEFSAGADGGSDDEDTDSDDDAESVDALEGRFLELEEEVANLVADVHDLTLYTKLNITGFMKILKVCRINFCPST